MGMAASQARLLTITARLADNELRSQTINNAKMRLATQSSQASENYINALNNATMTFTNYNLEGDTTSQPLTYNALTAYSSYNTQYGLVNASGELLVSEKEAAIFANCGNNLTNYLKDHGLEYKTTYFEELGNYTNAVYPEPYNLMSVEQLEDWYSRYTSFENSVEIENFENAIGKFVNADANLYKAGNQIMKQFILTDYENVPKLVYTEGGFTLKSFTEEGTETLAELLINTYRNYITGSGLNYPYNLEYLKGLGYISDSLYNDLKAETSADHFSIVTPLGTTAPNLKINEEIKPAKSYTEDDGITTTFVFGDGYTISTAAGFITGWNYTELESEEKDSGNTFSPIPFDGNINTISYKIENTEKGTSTTNYIEHRVVNGEDKFYTYTYLPLDNTADAETSKAQRNAIKEVLSDSINYIINRILDEADYEKFAMAIKDGQSITVGNTQINLKEAYGSTAITKVGNKTVNEILSEYQNAKESFIPKIFKDAATVEAAIGKDSITMKDANGNNLQIEKINSSGETKIEDDIRYVTPENLKNIEFVLQYAKERNLEFADDFNTVVKAYIMDNIIEVNGTPKYAWVDENDPTNTGNADAKAQWYTNLFHRMQQGYKQLENGLAASKEWIEYALESGIVSMEQVDKAFNWKPLDYKTCTRITEVTDDAAVAKAEAEYNRAMNDIKAKDNIYDLQLKNIDTEHTSLQTEYSVLEKVIQKNIERTFKFDQSA